MPVTPNPVVAAPQGGANPAAEGATETPIVAAAEPGPVTTATSQPEPTPEEVAATEAAKVAVAAKAAEPPPAPKRDYAAESTTPRKDGGE